MLDHVFDPYCQISRHNITNVSFQSGGAILGPPGAPGAPVRILFAVPEANALVSKRGMPAGRRADTVGAAELSWAEL